MVTTHCLPSGSLAANELGVPSISAANSQILTPVSGLKRGVVVWLHGMGVITQAVPINETGTALTFLQNLQSDGWVVINPPYAEDVKAALGDAALFTDVSNDTGHGSRYLTQMLHWWDHLVAYVKANYGNWPIIPFGISWGGWHATQIAKSKTSTIVGYGMHVPVTLLSGVANTLTTPTDFTATNTTGLDTASTDLNAVNLPGIIGWGTTDTVVGSTNANNLYTAAHNVGMPVTSNAVVEGHTFSSTDTTTYTNWFTNTIDPSYPKTF